MAFNGHWMNPKTQSADDVKATARAQEFVLGWFAEPLFGSGDYPASMKQYVAARSSLQGLSNSRLPEFTPTEKKANNGKNFETRSVNISSTVFLVNSNNTLFV